MAWSNEQKAFLVQCYIKTKSFKESLRLFCRNFNIDSRALPSKLPSKQIIIYWYKKFLATGSVQSRSKGAQHTKWRRTDEVIQDVLESVVDHPKRSLRRRSVDFPVSHTTMGRIIKRDLKARAYSLSTHQGISPQHEQDRVQMCNWFLGQLRGDETFLNRVWFSDESHFYLNGYVNSKKIVYWGFQKPDEVIEKNRHVQKVTAWVAMSQQGIIGPFWFVGENEQSVTVNSERYLEVLKQFWDVLGQRFAANRNLQWFMQDGASPHTAARVVAWLEDHFDGRLIGRRLPNPWAARSPDLNPLDFHLWGRIKDQMCGLTFENLADVREHVDTLISEISVAECQRVIEHFVRRVKKCIDRKGRHIEHAL